MKYQLINSILLDHLLKDKLCLNCNFKLFEWLFFDKNMNLLWQEHKSKTRMFEGFNFESDQ